MSRMSGSAIECIFCGKGAVGGSKDVKLYSGRDDDEYVHTIAVCNTCAARDSMGAESSTPVVPDPSSFPQGDGRVLGQQTDNSNLTPLHAESQMNEYEDFPRQNAEIGGVDFMGAEDSPSGDVIESKPMDYAPAEDQLFDEPVVQDEQDGGVVFQASHCGCGMDVCGTCGSCCSCMCAEEYYAESPLEESPLDANPSTEGPSDMGGPEDFSAEMPSWDSSNPLQRSYPFGRTTEYEAIVKKREKELENNPDIIYETRRIKEDLENLFNSDEIDEIDKYGTEYIVPDYVLYDSNELSPLSKEYIDSIAQSSDNDIYSIIEEADMSEESIRSGMIRRMVWSEIQAEKKKRMEAYIKHLQENYEGVNETRVRMDWYKIRVSDHYVDWEHDTYGDDAFTLKAENYGSKDARREAEAAAMMSSHVVPAPLGRGVDFDLGAETLIDPFKEDYDHSRNEWRKVRKYDTTAANFVFQHDNKLEDDIETRDFELRGLYDDRDYQEKILDDADEESRVYHEEELRRINDRIQELEYENRMDYEQREMLTKVNLGAEDSDAQLVTIDQPVLTGAKMALGVVALNATAIIGISLIGMAIGAAAERAKED